MTNALSKAAYELIKNGHIPKVEWSISGKDLCNELEVELQDGHYIADSTTHLCCTVAINGESSQFSKRFGFTARLNQQSAKITTSGFYSLQEWGWNEFEPLTDAEDAIIIYLSERHSDLMLPKWADLSMEDQALIENEVKALGEST